MFFYWVFQRNLLDFNQKYCSLNSGSLSQVFLELNSSMENSLLAEVSHNEAKWNERRETSAGFRRVSYHACPHVSLTASDVFVTCDTTQRAGLNLSASASGCWIWACAQILNGPIRVEDETTLRAAVVVDPITSLWGKLKRQILRQIRHLSNIKLSIAKAYD